MRSWDGCNDGYVIDSYDAFLASDSVKVDLKPEYILHFGLLPVSKRLQEFIALHPDAPYIQVHDSCQYINPSLSTNCFVLAGSTAFSEACAVVNTQRDYLDKWLGYHKRMRAQINTCAQESRMFEGSIVQKMQKRMPPDCRLVVSNSMPIRSVDTFFCSGKQSIKVLCNRGVSGIDGVVSTALGVSIAQFPTVLLTGDLSFFHDMNGLLVGKMHQLNLVIVLINNDGGGIFAYLPQHGLKQFEYLFLTPHGTDFSGTQTLYGLDHILVQDHVSFEQAFAQALSTKGIQVIEVRTDASLSKELHRNYTTLKE